MDFRTASRDLDGYVPFPDDRARAYQAAGHWTNEPLHALLDRAAESAPGKPFVVADGVEHTYSEVVSRSRRFAAFLVDDLGLVPRARIAVQVTNRPAFLPILFGCSRAGVVPVTLLPRHREAEARHVVSLTDARAYVTIGDSDRFDFVGMVDGIADELPTLTGRVAVGGDAPDGWTDYGSIIAGGSIGRADAFEPIDVNPCDPALLLLSGGTTGMPKAIPRTHNDYGFQWRKMAEVAGADPGWRTLTCGPIAHNGSILCVIGPTVVAGGTLVVEERLKPESLMAAIDRFDVNYLWAVPTQLVDVLEHPDVDDYDLSSLETLISGGQKIPPWTVRAFADRWDTTFLNAFGMAEGPLISVRPDDDIGVRTETVGRPLAPGADECRIVGEDRDETLPPGEPGELAVRGPGYFTGYFRNPEENAEAFDEDGWFYTEDVLELGDDGNYRVHGRLTETIVRGGENIYAPGVEDVLIEHPEVAHVAVVGMPDERLGERPMAYVELEPGVEALPLEELTGFLDDRGVAVFKRPERLEVLDALPRTEVDKIDKAALRERIEGTLRAEGRLPEN